MGFCMPDTNKAQQDNATTYLTHQPTVETPGTSSYQPLCEWVNARVVLCCHLLACAQAPCAHHLAAASTEGTALLAARVCATADTVTACEVACTLAVVAARVDLLLDVVHLRTHTGGREGTRRAGRSRRRDT